MPARTFSEAEQRAALEAVGPGDASSHEGKRRPLAAVGRLCQRTLDMERPGATPTTRWAAASPAFARDHP